MASADYLTPMPEAWVDTDGLVHFIFLNGTLVPSTVGETAPQRNRKRPSTTESAQRPDLDKIAEVLNDPKCSAATRVQVAAPAMRDSAPLEAPFHEQMYGDPTSALAGASGRDPLVPGLTANGMPPPMPPPMPLPMPPPPPMLRATPRLGSHSSDAVPPPAPRPLTVPIVRPSHPLLAPRTSPFGNSQAALPSIAAPSSSLSPTTLAQLSEALSRARRLSAALLGHSSATQVPHADWSAQLLSHMADYDAHLQQVRWPPDCVRSASGVRPECVVSAFASELDATLVPPPARCDLAARGQASGQLPIRHPTSRGRRRARNGGSPTRRCSSGHQLPSRRHRHSDGGKRCEGAAAI